jgi:hypothetical protein
MNITIRLAVDSDIPSVVKACEPYYNEIAPACFKDLYDYDHIFDTFSIHNSNEALLLLALDDDKIVGVIYFVIMDVNPYNKGVRVAHEIVFHSDPTLSAYSRMKVMRSLAKAAMVYMTQITPKLIDIGVKTEGLARCLEKLGFKREAIRLRKEI